MIKRREVRAAWRAFLGREPNDAMLAGHMALPTVAGLVAELAYCPEFAHRQALGGVTLIGAMEAFQEERDRAAVSD